MADPWGVDIEVNLSRFGAVPNLDWYRQIYNFLSDEARVSAALQQLAAAANATHVVPFLRHLAAVEAANGFSTDVAWLKDFQLGPVFQAIVAARRPLLDLGLQPTHGALTHRIQWAMVAMNFSAALPAGLTVADLYVGLTHINASQPKIASDVSVPFDGGLLSLWDVLVDAPYLDLEVADQYKRVRNARSPEYLMTYMRDHPSPAVKRLAEFSRVLAHVFLNQ
jgi:hypothetical protein